MGKATPRKLSGHRNDYFGQEVNIAARVKQLAGPGEIVLSGDVYADPDVVGLISPYDVVEDEGIMKGVSEHIPVFRVRAHDVG